MRLRVLGTLELLAEGSAAGFTTVVPLLSPKLRRLLAALAVHGGSVVSADRLADVLWGDQPPVNADGALHNLVSRLRAVLGGDDVLAVVTRAPGYALQAAARAVDSAEFTHLVAQARPRLGGEPDRAAALLDAALALWHGPAYAEFADEEFARAEVNRLEELRVTAAEYRVDAALALGLPEEAVVRLEPLARAHPLRERPHAQLVTALYRCGRHADALQVYRDFRQRLDEELGLQPSATFRRLEADVLRQDPGLTPPSPAPVWSVAAPAASAASGGASLPPPQPAACPPVARTVRGLPADPSPLVGRDEAVARLRSVLHGARVVTLTGPGGVGKTSLAAYAAGARDAPGYPDGTWLVELAAVSDPAAVPDAVSSVWSVQQRHGLSVTERLVDYLRPKRLLVVLDNCEHVVEAVAALVETVVSACPGVTVLATSREPLGVAGEHVQPVAPLPTPPVAARTAAEVASAPAVELFVARATAAAGDFTVSDAAAPAIAEICRRLDGIPLALELAAARMRFTAPAELVKRLDARLHVLRSTRRLAAERHRTLRAVVDWSYQLLPVDEREVFDLLSVFAGGFRLAAAEAVVAAAGGPATGVADLLDALVDKSMLVAQPGADRDGATRYRLLETLRAYGRDHLDERGLIERARRAHAEHYAEFLERAAPGLRGPDVAEAAEQIDQELDQLRAAHGWALATDLVLASRIVRALIDYVELRIPSEVFGWADATVAAAGPAADPVVLAVAASGARFRGDLTRAEMLAARAVEATAPSDPRRCYGLFLLLEVALFRGRLADSAGLAEELEPLATASGDPLRATFAPLVRALLRAYTGDPAGAADDAARARELALGTGSRMALAWTRYAEGEVRLDTEPHSALAMLEAALQEARAIGDRYLSGVVLVSAASLRARYGDPASAAATFLEAIEHWHQAGDWTHQWTTIRNVVDLLLRAGADEAAAVVHSVVTSRTTAAHAFGADAERLDEASDILRRRLGAETLAAAIRRGAAMGDHEAVRWTRSRLLEFVCEPALR